MSISIYHTVWIGVPLPCAPFVLSVTISTCVPFAPFVLSVPCQLFLYHIKATMCICARSDNMSVYIHVGLPYSLDMCTLCTCVPVHYFDHVYHVNNVSTIFSVPCANVCVYIRDHSCLYSYHSTIQSAYVYHVHHVYHVNHMYHVQK